MKKHFTSFQGIALLCFVLVFSLLACQRDIDDPGGGTTPTPSGEQVTAGIRGIVIDENNQPVLGATVTSGTNTTTTDRYGVFRFNNISLLKANGYVKVTKPGYFTGTRSFLASAGRIHNVRIRLLPKSVTGTFAAATGGTVNVAGGGKLVMPAAAITDAAGNAYTGTVNVAMTWINPTAPDLSEIIPGDLRGITTAGEERGLQTFGMLGVELTGSGGQALKIASGKTAELTFPIPAALSASAPATIDLWYFDETTARWKQEGQATKTGSNYVGNVSHFSFWNCDAPFPVVNLCMTLVNATNSQPMNNVMVRIRRANNSYGSGYTDSLGNLCGLVPKDEPLVLELIDPCFNVSHSQNIGPFSSATNLGTLSIPLSPTNTLTITGTVTNCSGGNVTNGAAIVYTGGGYSYSVPVVAGVFTFSLLRCGTAPLNFSVLGIDYTTLQQGTPVSGTGTTGTVNVGTVQACGTSASEYIEFIVDGTPEVYTQPPHSVSAFDSTATPPFSNKTTVDGTKTIGGVTSFSTFTFDNNSVPASGLPLSFCYVTAGGVTSFQVITPSPVINITAFGPPATGFIEGNFSVQMNFSGTPRNVVCNFRVRR